MKCPKCDSENPETSRFCGNCAAPLTQPQDPSFSQTKTFDGYEQNLERGSLFAERYEVIEELGSGGMGKVYKVYDKKIKEIVALKLIRPELATKPKTIERFRDEIRLARKIVHKNICRMYDLNEEQGTSYITMEYVPGEDLKSMIRMMGKLSPGQALFIGKQVCAGLAEAHKLGVIHRDLKPKNVMVDREGNARIMDFGLARSLEEKGITGGRVMIGTAEYMSPEQAEGQKTDGRSDIYSFGVILFEMVTGRLLFEGETALSVALKHKTEPPPDPRKINPEIPEVFSRLILKCLEKTREKRYQTTEALLAELNQIEREFPSEERVFAPKKSSVFRDITQPLGRKKVFLPVLAVLAVLAATVIIRPLLSRKSPVSLSASQPYLAVLFFKNNTGDTGLDFLRQTLADNLTQELRMLSGNIRVVSPDYIKTILIKLHLEEARDYSSENVKEVAAKTKTSHVLLGNYLKVAGRPRINYELREARKSEAEGYQGIIDGQSGDDFVKMTEAVAKDILANLHLPLEPHGSKLPISSDLANKYFSWGRRSEGRFKAKEHAQAQDLDFIEAVGWYQKSLQEDPNFVRAYRGLGDIQQALYVNTQRLEDLGLMLRYYEQAYQIDPLYPGANAGLGWAYFIKGDNDKAYDHFKKAFELAPEDPDINNDVASFLRSIGLPDRAIKYYSNAIHYGGLPQENYKLRAMCYEHIGKTKEAVDDAKKLVDLETEDLRIQLYYARQLIMHKKFAEAERQIAVVERLDPSNKDISLTRAYLYAARGDKEKALAMVKEAEKKPIYYSYLLSQVYAAVNEKDRAIENIQIGIKRGFQEIQNYLYEYPLLLNNFFYDPLRSDLRFIDILKGQEKKYYDDLRKYGGL
jgi:serine/threonine protein kinase/Tfp pilus assembly protein PilF